MHLGHHPTSALLTGIQAEVICGGIDNRVTYVAVGHLSSRGSLGYRMRCAQIFTYPSQAGENGELPLKSSKPNGFHRIFHHESVWEGKGGREEGSITHLVFVIAWHLGGSPDRLIDSRMSCSKN